MSALLDSLAADFKGDPARADILVKTVQDGLPPPRSEAWKYTSLRTLERRTFTPPDATIADFDAELLDGIPAPRLVFVNGRFDAAHSDTHNLPVGIQFEATTPAFEPANLPAGTDAVFSRLNAILATTGALLKAAANTISDTPFHLVTISTETGTDHAWHLRHRLDISSGAKIQLMEYHLSSGAPRHLDNSVLELHLSESAKLTHIRIQSSHDSTSAFLHTEGELQAHADYTRIDLELGSALMRHELDIKLLGDHASLTANGILLVTARRHIETRLEIEHLARNTRCNLNWRGIANGRGRVVFHGGITIHSGADGTEAALSSKNLLLSENAEIDTQPVLVIHADEVQAAHGATVGQLDTNALFYLRSRGIPLPQARQLLTAAFVCELLLVLIGNPQYADIQQRLERALQEMVTFPVSHAVTHST